MLKKALENTLNDSIDDYNIVANHNTNTRLSSSEWLGEYQLAMSKYKSMIERLKGIIQMIPDEVEEK